MFVLYGQNLLVLLSSGSPGRNKYVVFFIIITCQISNNRSVLVLLCQFCHDNDLKRKISENLVFQMNWNTADYIFSFFQLLIHFLKNVSSPVNPASDKRAFKTFWHGFAENNESNDISCVNLTLSRIGFKQQINLILG